ncbi:ash family protein [Sodalis glossinidius]|uniref:ash family protein n=1 Tax=Sodalis glossinidius TaxID=63612 RepID=UPI0013053600|nr:ash family protein [Sodalis glossinidius]
MFGLDSMIGGRYSHLAAANSVAGFETPYIVSVPEHAPKACFLLPVVTHSMVAQAGQPKGWPGSDTTGSLNPVWAATNELETSGGGCFTIVSEAVIMTTTLTQAKTIEIVEPKVFEQNGKILTTSFDVAAYFRKRHDDVLKKFEPL